MTRRRNLGSSTTAELTLAMWSANDYKGSEERVGQGRLGFGVSVLLAVVGLVIQRMTRASIDGIGRRSTSAIPIWTRRADRQAEFNRARAAHGPQASAAGRRRATRWRVRTPQSV
jgi:hypothetical protein